MFATRPTPTSAPATIVNDTHLTCHPTPASTQEGTVAVHVHAQYTPLLSTTTTATANTNTNINTSTSANTNTNTSASASANTTSLGLVSTPILTPWVTILPGSALYAYTLPPVLVAVVPTGGGSTGGTPLTVYGVGWNTALPALCHFDGVTVPAVVINATTLTCVTPPYTR